MTSKPKATPLADDIPLTIDINRGELVPIHKSLPKVQGEAQTEQQAQRSGVTFSSGALILSCVGVGAFALGVGLKANSIVASLLAVAVAAALAAVAASCKNRS